MVILGVILVLWWAAFALLTVRDYRRRPRVAQPDLPPGEVLPTPRWPSWRDCFARPVLFLLIPWFVLVHVLLFILIWPCFLLHRIYFPPQTRREEA